MITSLSCSTWFPLAKRLTDLWNEIAKIPCVLWCIDATEVRHHCRRSATVKRSVHSRTRESFGIEEKLNVQPTTNELRRALSFRQIFLCLHSEKLYLFSSELQRRFILSKEIENAACGATLAINQIKMRSVAHRFCSVLGRSLFFSRVVCLLSMQLEWVNSPEKWWLK